MPVKPAMKAVVWTAYGPPEVLRLKEVEKPAPKDNELLIRIHAAAVSAGDCEQRGLKLPLFLKIPMRLYIGLRKPRRITILGMDLAGEVEETGKLVKRFKKGDQVLATTGFVHIGSYAEYICLPEEDKEAVIITKPAEMTYEEACVVPTGGLEALYFIRKGNIRSGESVLINGAGGTIGCFAVQLARYYGARVIAVDSAGKLEMLQAIGADEVIDYNRVDFTASGSSYDVIFDVVGKSSFTRSIKLLKPDGRYIIANPGLSQMVLGLAASVRGRRKVIVGGANPTAENLRFLKQLIEQGRLQAVVDRVYPLDQIVQAHKYVESGLKKGNVVITPSHNV